MGLNLDDKKAVVAEVAAQLADAQTIVVAEYSGVQVTDLTVLRAKARQSGVYLRVLKNTLVRRAVAEDIDMIFRKMDAVPDRTRRELVAS